jgi:hypothetical protein
MLTLDQFESGFRLDQYIAHLQHNKENFRANFIKASECISPDDLAFFRSLPQRVHVAVLTADASPDALRDVPIISRLSAEVNRVSLRLFDEHIHADVVEALRRVTQGECAAGQPDVPRIAFFDENMAYVGAQCGPLPEVAVEMQQRRQAWVHAHPEVVDATAPVEHMSPITRTRLTQVIYAMTPELRVAWGGMLIARCRQILATIQNQP